MNSTVTVAVTVMAEAEDNVAVSRVDFYIDSQRQYADSAAPWSFLWDCLALPDSTLCTIFARAYDPAGNIGTSPEVAVLVRNVPADTRPPAAVVDLVVRDPSPNTARLAWTAPGDDDDSGTASLYDVRYSAAIITPDNFNDADTAAAEPAPSSSGTRETLIVSNLNPGMVYYFALKTADEVPNWSSMSNAASCTTGVPSATWQKTFGGALDDVCYAVCPVPGAGYVAAGYTRSAGSACKIFLIKTDYSGGTVWEEAVGAASLQTAFSVVAANGAVVIAGDRAGVSVDAYAAEIGAAGEVVWEKAFGGAGWDRVYAVAADGEGGYVMTGETSSFGAGDFDLYLARTDAFGNQVWQRSFGGSGRDGGSAVVVSPEGGYLVAGWTDSFGAGRYDVYLVRLDALGNSLWTRTFGGPGDDLAYGVATVPDGGYIVAGATNSFGAGAADTYLLRLNASGDTLWTKTIGGAGADLSLIVALTPDGGYIMVGSTSSTGAGASDICLIRADALGNVSWQKTYGGTSDDEGWSVAPTADGGYIIGGSTRSFGAGQADAYLIKTDAAGEVNGALLKSAVGMTGGRSPDAGQLLPGRPIPR